MLRRGVFLQQTQKKYPTQKEKNVAKKKGRSTCGSQICGQKQH